MNQQLLFVSIALALSTTAQAEVNTKAKTHRQATVQVTATRNATSLSDSLASVSVITRQDIERSQAPSLLELLRLQAGIDLARSGGSGQATSLFMRGTNSNHVLILVDGVRVASTNTGAYDLTHFSLQQIERVEIVRGPRASLYGSDAIGGVLQIFTRDPESIDARIATGSYGRYEGAASFGIKGEQHGFGVTLNGTSVDGFSATNPRAFGHHPDDDGHIQRAASVRGYHHFGAQKLSGIVRQIDADNDFDQGRSKVLQQSLQLQMAGEITQQWTHELTAAHLRDELATIGFDSLFDTRRSSLDWHNRYALNEAHALQFAANLIDEAGKSYTPTESVFDKTRQSRAAVFGYSGNIGAQQVELTGRYDHDSSFGDQFTGQVGWGFNLDAWKFSLSYGEGYRAPNFNELYHPGYGGYFAGNPRLNPEFSESLEAGLGFEISESQSVNVNIFSTRIDNLISYSGGALAQAENIAKTNIDGVELTHHWQRDAWSLQSQITVQDPENASNGNTLLRRAKRKASSSLWYQVSDTHALGGEVFLVGARADFGTHLHGYGLLNLRHSWQLSDSFKLDTRLENVFDRDYSLVDGYNTPGRNWMLAISYSAK